MSLFASNRSDTRRPNVILETSPALKLYRATTSRPYLITLCRPISCVIPMVELHLKRMSGSMLLSPNINFQVTEKSPTTWRLVRWRNRNIVIWANI
jgi:hypothetical protein